MTLGIHFKSKDAYSACVQVPSTLRREQGKQGSNVQVDCCLYTSLVIFTAQISQISSYEVTIIYSTPLRRCLFKATCVKSVVAEGWRARREGEKERKEQEINGSSESDIVCCPRRDCELLARALFIGLVLFCQWAELLAGVQRYLGRHAFDFRHEHPDNNLNGMFRIWTVGASVGLTRLVERTMQYGCYSIRTNFRQICQFHSCKMSHGVHPLSLSKYSAQSC